MNPNDDLYYNENAVKYYDCAYESKKDLIDTSFYLEQASKYGSPILEIACGTGRILCEIAKKGISIDGLDYSGAMLSVLRQKIDKENLTPKVNLYQKDMRTFELQKKYKLVIIPFRPMQHMYTIEDQIQALTCAKNHLQENGTIIFDLFYPKFQNFLTGNNEESYELKWPDPENANYMIHRYFIRRKVDFLHQYFEGEFLFRTFEGSKIIKEERSPLKMSFYTYPQVLLLLRCCGLEIVEEYGSFEKEDISVEKEMIFVVRPSKI